VWGTQFFGSPFFQFKKYFWDCWLEMSRENDDCVCGSQNPMQLTQCHIEEEVLGVHAFEINTTHLEEKVKW